MDSTQEKETTIEPTVIGVPPENILTTETSVVEEVLPTIAFDTPLPWHKNKKVLAAVLVAIVLLGGAGGYTYYMQKTGGGTVAVVNGTRIYKKEFNESVALIEKNATLQGIDLAQEGAQKEIYDQALEVLINNSLLIGAATKAGFAASDEDIQKKYDELATQLGGAETLTIKMAEVGLTEEKLRSNIAERILSDLYIESVTTIEDVKVSDEEVKEFLKSINTGDAKLPPLDEIRPQIEEQILGQKRQQIVTDLLAKLRSEGKVEIKI
jgi:hypothetical protein